MAIYFKGDGNPRFKNRFDASVLVEGDLVGPDKLKFVKRTGRKER